MMHRQGQQGDVLSQSLFLPHYKSPSGAFWLGLVPEFKAPNREHEQGFTLFRALRQGERDRTTIEMQEGKVVTRNKAFVLREAEVHFMGLQLEAVGLYAVPPRTVHSIPLWFFPHEQLENLRVELMTLHAIQSLLAVVFP